MLNNYEIQGVIYNVLQKVIKYYFVVFIFFVFDGIDDLRLRKFLQEFMKDLMKGFCLIINDILKIQLQMVQFKILDDKYFS